MSEFADEVGPPTRKELSEALDRARAAFNQFKKVEQQWARTHCEMDSDGDWREHVLKQIQELIKAQQSSMELIGALMLVVASQGEEVNAWRHADGRPMQDPTALLALAETGRRFLGQ